MRKVPLVTAAVVAAVIFFALATLPPRPQTVETNGFDADLMRRTVRGAYHVHTTRSDGASDKPTIARAAARAGLQFVIFTDHGDGMMPPDPPVYLSGVLCIDGVEISTNGGHYVALGMRPAPYPLGGDPSAVVEDVARLGGFGIAAHPDSPKPSLAWTEWDAPIDGIEWLSADTEWRDESRTTLARVFLHYLFRPAPALASMLDRPVATLKRWDALTRRRPIVALAAHDAHGGIGRGVEESGARKRTIGNVPSYEASFRTFSDNVILDAALTGNAGSDAGGLLDAIRRGRVFTVVDAVASPGFADLRSERDVLRVAATVPRDGELVVVANGSETLSTATSELVTRMGSHVAAARAEIRVRGAAGTPPVPWLVTNPVYFLPPSVPQAPSTDAGRISPLPRTLTWHVEKDPRSTATMGETAGVRTIRYTLAAGAKTSQFVALVADVNQLLGGIHGLQFSASAERPARMSVQLRYDGSAGERWGSSVYVDSTSREFVISVDRMRPLDRQTGPPPAPATASSLLFVVDLTNARPGDSNALTIANVRAQSPASRAR